MNLGRTCRTKVIQPSHSSSLQGYKKYLSQIFVKAGYMLSDKARNEIASVAVDKEKSAQKASEGNFDNLYQCTEVCTYYLMCKPNNIPSSFEGQLCTFSWVLFVKSNENTYPKGRAIMQYRVVPITKKVNYYIQKITFDRLLVWPGYFL